MTLDKWVKRLRERAGLSQTAFGKMVGVSFATVNRWENGHSTPSPLALKKLEAMAGTCLTVTLPLWLARRLRQAAERSGKDAESLARHWIEEKIGELGC